MQVLSRLLVIAGVAALAVQEPREARVALQGKDIVYFHGALETAVEARPLLVLLPPNAAAPVDAIREFAARWQPLAASLGWRLAVPWTAGGAPAWTDFGVKALEAVVEDCRKRAPVDPSRVYLAGAGDGASEVFYAAVRSPDVWTAALAIQGNPKTAIDTNRLFAANTTATPVLWVVGPESAAEARSLRDRLAAASYNLELLAAENPDPQQIFGWLAGRKRDPAPVKIDCETGSPAFGRCWWLEVVKFDPALRNDVLRSSRVPPGSGAYLDLGGFGFNAAEPGPGVLVSWLPPGYAGPLKPGDRIVTVAGRALKDAHDYIEFMDAAEARPAAVLLQRGKERMRFETRIVLPRREETWTARVQAELLPDLREVQIISRGAAEMRVNLPSAWLPVRLNWNGTELGEVKGAGCLLLTAPSSLGRCQ